MPPWIWPTNEFCFGVQRWRGAHPASGSKRFFYINWEIPPQHEALTCDAFENVLRQDQELARSDQFRRSLEKQARGHWFRMPPATISPTMAPRRSKKHPARQQTLERCQLPHHRTIHPSNFAGVSRSALIALLGIVTAILTTWRLPVLPGLRV